MKKASRFGVLVGALILLVFMAAACTPGQVDYIDEVYEVTYPDGTAGVIEATSIPQVTQCNYFDESFRDYLGKYIEDTGVTADQLESFCLEHYEDRSYPDL